MFDSLVKFLLLCAGLFNLYLLLIVYAGLGSGEVTEQLFFIIYSSPIH